MKIKVMAAVAAVAVMFGGASQVMAQSPFFPPPPAFPVIQTPTQITGFNPATGGFNTAGTTVFNTAFDPFRQASMFNGTARPVNQPVFNSFGQPVGWQQGVAWQNSVTGQTHFQGQVMRPNGVGGVNTQTVFRYAPPARTR